MEPSIHEQLLRFSEKHLPPYLQWFIKWPPLLKLLSRMLCLEEIIILRDKLADKHNYELLHELVMHAGLTFNVKNLEKVPPEGRVLIVANHPLGGADWVMLVECLSAIRKDIRVVINKDVNTLIVNMRDLFIPVDQYASFNDTAREKIGESLEMEEAVILYPSGGISILTRQGVRDRKWKNGAVRFSREHHADILPVYIGGRFRLIFYLYPIRLRRFLLVRNMLHPTFKKVNFVIGNRVSYKDMMAEDDLSLLSSRLREMTYQLRHELHNA